MTPSIFAGYGFVRMAWECAQLRDLPGITPDLINPVSRNLVAESGFPASREFYRILDSATAAWHATAPERALGICQRISL